MLMLHSATRRHFSCSKSAYNHIRLLATQAEPKSEIIVDVKENLPAPKPKKPQRKPFAKNLFLGIMDHEFLTYPEPQHWDRYNEFEPYLQSIQNYMSTVNPKEFEDSGTIPSHVIQRLRELRVFGARIHEDYRGMNLLNSEFLRVLETVGTIPSLGLFLLKQAVPPINIFNKYATVEQKLRYLPKMATGQSLATVAVTEANSGPVVKSLETVAVQTQDDKHWLLEGEKTFVSNANLSNVFIVFAHGMQSGALEKRPETISAYIVDADVEGVTIAKDSIATLGLKGFNTGRLIMKNAKIPVENMIGEIGTGCDILTDQFTQTRHYIACLTIPVLKNLLNAMTKDLIHKKHIDKMYYEIPAIQKIIAEIKMVIFSIESSLYMATAASDIYQDQDLLLEYALVEQFAVQESLRVLLDALSGVGPRACTLVEPYEQYLRDIFTITNYETSLLDTKTYAAILGLQHVGLTIGDQIKKDRNPLHYPLEAVKRWFDKEPKLNLYIEDHLHQSLKECAQFCDRCIYRFVDSVDDVIIRHGAEVSDHQLDLHRLSDMVTSIYVYLACMGRASRSYCIGNRDSEHEIRACLAMAYRLYQKMKQINEQIDHSEYANGDLNLKELSTLHFDRKYYYFAHPLQRNY
ncbi:hypothetical protein QAD02_010823 [Eretmocerus hayati]|uniref:Uncharacterized protein n=1 Tax=Eretmocerus hayati TaxID=131215 RepID=A0ACC2NV76_9HYME|nr:hypothetical protein QAD02_010823 [Eretmocerus hayati]